MDFKHSDIHSFLLQQIPGRFKSLTPLEFKSFIQYLFEVDGYRLHKDSVKEGVQDILEMDKEGVSLVIQSYLNKPELLVGIKEINQAIENRTKFQVDQSWIVTTSAYTDEARHIAEEADIELWDWDALKGALEQMFFEGRSYLEDLQTVTSKEIPPDESDLKLKVKWQATEGISAEWFNLGITVSNPSPRNIYITLQLPALIDQKKNQVMADNWAEGDFVTGMIYAGASIKTNALFSVAKVGDRPSGGRIVLTCYERAEVPLTYHLTARLKGEACYVVTYCYTRQSPEYLAMIDFRDDVLCQSSWGRGVIGLYYWLSPHLVSWATHCRLMDIGLRKLMTIIIPIFLKNKSD